MINARNAVNLFMEKLKTESYFKNKSVIHSFSYNQKPTVMTDTVISVGLKEINIDDNSLGQNVKSGTISIFCDVFMPYARGGAEAERIVCEICKCIKDFNIVSISVSDIFADENTQCLVMKSVFTFNDEITFEGD